MSETRHVVQLTDGTIIIEPPGNQPIDPDKDILFLVIRDLVKYAEGFAAAAVVVTGAQENQK